jgi:hypothetical protein
MEKVSILINIKPYHVSVIKTKTTIPEFQWLAENLHALGTH